MTECMSCGGFVTDDYARVFGDNENNVYDCRNCKTDRRTRSSEKSENESEKVLLRTVRGDDAAYSAGRGNSTASVDDPDDTESPTAVADGGVEPDVTDHDEGDTHTDDAGDGGDGGRFGRFLSKFR